MSSAGAPKFDSCVSKPKEHATGLIGFATLPIRRSSLIGGCNAVERPSIGAV